MIRTSMVVMLVFASLLGCEQKEAQLAPPQTEEQAAATEKAASPGPPHTPKEIRAAYGALVLPDAPVIAASGPQGAGTQEARDARFLRHAFKDYLRLLKQRHAELGRLIAIAEAGKLEADPMPFRDALSSLSTFDYFEVAPLGAKEDTKTMLREAFGNPPAAADMVRIVDMVSANWKFANDQATPRE